MNLKVLQGFIDIGGQASRYSRAIQDQGYFSKAWFYERTLKNADYDRLLDFSSHGLFRGRLRKGAYLALALAKFNIWHIHKGFSMFHNGKDLNLANKLGKKIIVHYRGREIRPEMHVNKLPFHIEEKVKREAEVAACIFVKDGQLMELIAPHAPKAILFPNIVSTDGFTPVAEQPLDYFDDRRKLRVTHVPSNPKYKGTERIREAMLSLRDLVDYRELTAVPHTEALQAFWNSDIVIDQIITGTYGNVSLESMALGKCVVNFLNANFTKYEPETPPIVNASATDLAEVIFHLGRNRAVIFETGAKGKDFVAKHHSPEAVGKLLVKSYESILRGETIDLTRMNDANENRNLFV
jgi:hypothetical protein